MRVPVGSVPRSRLGGGLGGGAAGAVPAVDRLLGDSEGGAHRVPREAERAVEVDGGRDQGLDTVPQLLGETDGRGGGASVDDEARGGAGAARAVDVAQLGGERAQRVHLPADPLDVPHQQVQAGPSLGVVGCVVGHEQASRTGVEEGSGRDQRPVVVNSSLDQRGSRRWSRPGGVWASAYAPRGDGARCSRPGVSPSAARPAVVIDWCAARPTPVREAVPPMKLVFAGTPEVAVPALDALLASGRHEVAAVVTRPDAPAGRGRRLVASPVAERAEEAGVEVLKPAKPRDRGVPGPAARHRPGLLPRRRLRRAAAAGRPRHPRPRLGQSALLAAARLARRGPRAALHHGRGRDHRRLHLPDRGGARLRDRSTAPSPRRSAPPTPAATC
ncbi:Methionyl-tRNA formyltransferase [Streptomyces glaucescens]